MLLALVAAIVLQRAIPQRYTLVPRWPLIALEVALLLRPVRPTWLSFANEPLADTDFLAERPAVIESGRFDLSGDAADSTESGR